MKTNEIDNSIDNVINWMKQHMKKLKCDCFNKILHDRIIWTLMKLVIQLTMWLIEWSNTWQSEGATTWIKSHTIWFALWLY
jgi:hypothetical protein